MYGGAAGVLLGNQLAIQIQAYLAAVKRADGVVPLARFNLSVGLYITMATSSFVDVAVEL